MKSLSLHFILLFICTCFQFKLQCIRSLFTVFIIFRFLFDASRLSFGVFLVVVVVVAELHFTFDFSFLNFPAY